MPSFRLSLVMGSEMAAVVPSAAPEAKVTWPVCTALLMSASSAGLATAAVEGDSMR